MYFDFCICKAPAAASSPALDTIYHLCGDSTYRTPRKPVTAGKRYFVYTTLGSGVIRYDGHEFTVRQGDFLLMCPLGELSYRCEADDWHFWWFECWGELPLPRADEVCAAPAGDFVLALFEHSLASAKADRWDIAASLFFSAAGLLGQSRGNTPRADAFLRAERYIRENLQTVTVAELCGFLQQNERTLRNLFYAAAELSPKQYISKIRLETARQLLEGTLLSVEDISQRLGFSSQFHLSRSFKERFGLPPLQYRRYFQP